MSLTGLKEFWDLFSLAISISPYDGDKTPSVSMIELIGRGREINMDEVEFWKCVSFSIKRVREKVFRDRKTAIEKARIQNKCR